MPAAPLSSGAEEYLSWLAVERGRARNTVVSYRRDLAAYEARLAARGRIPVDAGPADVADHVAALRERGSSAASVARALSVVRGLHQFLVEEGLAPADPTADVEGVRLPGRLPKALSEAEVVRLLEAAGGTGPGDRRDRALLEVLYATGGRISEVVGLDLADLTVLSSPPGTPLRPSSMAGSSGGGDPAMPPDGDPAVEAGLLRLYGKGAKERLVPLGRHAAAALDAWLSPEGRGRFAPVRWRRRGDAEAVFLNARGGRLGRQGAFAVVRARADRAGLGDRVSPHVLRHSCATHMLARGADVRVVQELLGHASVTTTQLYTKVTGEHLRAAYEASHPRAGIRQGGNL